MIAVNNECFKEASLLIKVAQRPRGFAFTLHSKQAVTSDGVVRRLSTSCRFIHTFTGTSTFRSNAASPSPNISFTDDAVPSKRPIAEELNAEKPRPCACNCRLIWILAVTATSPSNQLYGLYEQCPFNLTYTPCSSSLQTRPHQPFFLK